MPYVACPSCGERGKIPPTLVGSRIKCKKCGISFNVAPSAAKVPAAEGVAVAAGPAAGTGDGGIAVDGLDASAWAVASDQPPEVFKGEHDAAAPEAAAPEAAEPAHPFEAHHATGVKEYKVLWSRDKLFEGKFDVPRLEEALNYFANRDGWRRRCARRISRTSVEAPRKRSWSCSSARPPRQRRSFPRRLPEE